MDDQCQLEDYRYRLRGVALPTKKAVAKIEDAELRNRASLLFKATSTLFSNWHLFASEYFSDMPELPSDELWHVEFLHTYAQMLWQFKRARKSSNEVSKYAHGVRVRVWDKTRNLIGSISDRYKNMEDDYFYDRFGGIMFSTGMLSGEMQLFARGAMNAPEYVIHFQQSRRKGADAIHTENRAMKADVFKWLDDNFASCKSMDAAAEAMAGKLVPATFRTVRDWVTEWKKLRSASTP